MRMRFNRITPTKLLILGYLMLIMTGTALLTLPVASRAAHAASFMDALFTSASASCVTGLIVHDTYTYWSPFGQGVILVLIQIGGLGFVTMAIAMITFTKRRISLKERSVMQESIAAPQMAGIVRLTRFVFYSTIACESVGAIILSLRLCPELGFAKGIYFAVFHSVSAFCNAGFDLMGTLEPNSSLSHFSGDITVNIAIMCLIVIGGLGFFVWEDLWQHRLHWNKYKLQTKIVLSTTGWLIAASTILFFFIEWNGAAFAGKSVGEKALASLFQSITPRTAGFNTVNLSQLRDSSLILTMLLMLVGGSPGSTAGGIKTTTAAVLTLSVSGSLSQRQHIECFGRRIDLTILRNAITILTIYLLLFISAAIAISWIDGTELAETMFESASAIGTVGLSLGITPDLSVLSRLILIFLMFFGRVGCLTILYAIARNHTAVPSKMPLERIVVG